MGGRTAISKSNLQVAFGLTNDPEKYTHLISTLRRLGDALFPGNETTDKHHQSRQRWGYLRILASRVHLQFRDPHAQALLKKYIANYVYNRNYEMRANRLTDRSHAFRVLQGCKLVRYICSVKQPTITFGNLPSLAELRVKQSLDPTPAPKRGPGKSHNLDSIGMLLKACSPETLRALKAAVQLAIARQEKTSPAVERQPVLENVEATTLGSQGLRRSQRLGSIRSGHRITTERIS